MSTRSDGDKHWESAEKALKKNILSLRFSPDYVVAALEFRQAASCYQANCDYGRAVEALTRLAGIRDQQVDYYEAGRCHEEAATIMTRELKRQEEAYEHMQRAAGYFERCGKLDAGVRVLVRLSEAQEQCGDIEGSLASIERAIQLYQLDQSEKHHQMSDLYKKAVRLCVAHDRLTACLTYLNEHDKVLRAIKQHSNVYKNHLACVAIHLHHGNSSAADQAISDGASTDGQFFSSREFAVASEALDAYRDGDVEKFSEVMNRQTWSFLSTDLANLARNVPPPRGRVTMNPKHSPSISVGDEVVGDGDGGVTYEADGKDLSQWMV